MYLPNNQVLKYIRLLSIYNVNSNSIEWYVEQAYRYYSKTYHTPLHVARKNMIPAEVVQIFMEDEMADMNPEDVTALKDRLVKVPKPMLNVEDYQPEEDTELSDEEWVMQQMAEAAKNEKNTKPKPKANPGPSMGDAMSAAQKAVQNLYSQLNKPTPDKDEGEIKFNKE